MKTNRFLLLALAGLCCGPLARADEGMWLPNLIGERIADMRSKGFTLSAEEIYDANQPSMKDAVVLFGRGCTGEIVSPEGLLLTNHHCGYGQIQRHSSVENDYLTRGFWARSREEELPNPELSVSILVRMEDVTERMLAGIDDGAGGDERDSLLERNRSRLIEQAGEGGRYEAAVEELYYGNRYYLFVYEVFRDVRLVAAPPSSIGKFGGDTDNWMWPRHTGDFSLFRIYADSLNRPAPYSPDNVPYRPRRYFPISAQGVSEGDFTMIYGFPGNTQRYVISDAVDYVLNRSNPSKIKLRTLRLQIISAAQQADPATRIRYAAKHASIANAWKKWQGESRGLQRLGTIRKKRAYEERFAAWAASRPEYVGLLDSMRSAYASLADAYWRSEYFAESIEAVEMTRMLRTLRDMTPERVQAGEWAQQAETFYKDYDAGVDRRLAEALYAEFLRDMPARYVPAEFTAAIERHGGVAGYAAWLFEQSVFASSQRLAEAVRDTLSWRRVLQEDPLARQIEAFERSGHFSQKRYRNLSDAPKIARWYRPYLRALMAFDSERAFFPDANLTLRVAYGRVGGYDAADGEWHKHQTTLEGIIEKDNPDIYDYDIPQRLRELHASKDYGRWSIVSGGRRTVPVAFIASNHTTGGNSGSPVLNARGELVGLNFDRTWLSTMSDIEFDPEICRNIAVDIRYVLFVIEKVGEASYLLEEMDIR